MKFLILHQEKKRAYMEEDEVRYIFPRFNKKGDEIGSLVGPSISQDYLLAVDESPEEVIELLEEMTLEVELEDEIANQN